MRELKTQIPSSHQKHEANHIYPSYHLAPLFRVAARQRNYTPENPKHKTFQALD